MPTPALAAQKLSRRNNIDMLNAARNVSSYDYQRRIPAVDKANIAQTQQLILSAPDLQNELIVNLVNKIGRTYAHGVTFQNELAVLKRDSLLFGSTIEEIYVGMIKAQSYYHDRDSLESDVWGKALADVGTAYHSINSERKYKITVQEATFRRAFLSDYGLNDFITELMKAPTTADEFDEFLITANLLVEHYKNDGFFKVNVPDVGALGSDGADARYMLRRLRELATVIKYPSTHFNAAKMPSAARPESLVLIVTEKAMAAMDVEALAAAFNLDKANIPYRIIELPSHHLPIPGLQAILTTEDFFVIADTLYTTRNISNPDGLYENFWVHHHGIYSISPFMPAILFWTGEGDEITDEPTSVVGISPITIYDKNGDAVTRVKRGESYLVAGSALTDPEGGFNDAIRLRLSTNKAAEDIASRFTLIRNSGSFYVGIDEPASQITIVATSADDDSFTETQAVEVYGDRLTPFPHMGVIPDEDEDGQGEVTPVEPTRTDNTVKIPAVTGVQYRNGTTPVNNNSVVPIVDGTPLTITAVARAGYELASGATASWTYTYTATS